MFVPAPEIFKAYDIRGIVGQSLDAAFAEHDEIYRLIKQGDADGARNSIRRHIEGSAHYVRVALDKKWQTA